MSDAGKLSPREAIELSIRELENNKYHPSDYGSRDRIYSYLTFVDDEPDPVEPSSHSFSSLCGYDPMEKVAESRGWKPIAPGYSMTVSWSNHRYEIRRLPDGSPDDTEAISEPGPSEPAAPVDWPTEPGLWRDLSLDEEWYFWVEKSGESWTKGKWVKCTVTLPPIREPKPKPKPERPTTCLLYARLPCHKDWEWFIRCHNRWDSWPDCEMEGLIGTKFIEVDRSASDAEALAIYDAETASKPDQT